MEYVLNIDSKVVLTNDDGLFASHLQKKIHF